MTYLITGANRGIGLQLTRTALQAKFQVYALVRDPERATELQAELTRYPDSLKIIPCEVSSRDSILAAQKAIGDKPIDVLINNAGVMGESNFINIKADEMLRVFKVNVLGVMDVTLIFLPSLQLSTQPKLISITSLMGSIGDNDSGGYYAYRISKAALNMFMKSFSIEFPRITTLALHPGWVQTDMGGTAAPLTSEVSAQGLFKVIESAKPKQSGGFYDYSGKELPW